jgi:hypothetical protein
MIHFMPFVTSLFFKNWEFPDWLNMACMPFDVQLKCKGGRQSWKSLKQWIYDNNILNI